MCKIASILQIPPFRMPLRDEKAKNSPRFSVVRAKTGAVPCFGQLIKTFTLLNTLNFARRRRGYLCPRQDMEANRQLAGKLVPAAPAFPLPSATLAERVSDRERKAWASSPRRSQCSRYGRIWKPSAAISLAKPRTVSSETSYGSRPMFLRLARMLLGTVIIWQPHPSAW